MSGGNDASAEASRARTEEEQRQGRIRQGTERIRDQFAKAFSDKYYKDFRKAGENYYTPQLTQQYEDSLKQLQAALARSGLSQSSAHETQLDRVNREKLTAEGQVANNLTNMINTRKADVANQESIAVGQLQGSADMNAAAAHAQSLIKQQSALPGWSPLGQVFTDASAFLANQSEAERSGNPRYNMGVSQWGNNSRRFLQNVGT